MEKHSLESRAVTGMQLFREAKELDRKGNQDSIAYFYIASGLLEKDLKKEILETNIATQKRKELLKMLEECYRKLSIDSLNPYYPGKILSPADWMSYIERYSDINKELEMYKT